MSKGCHNIGSRLAGIDRFCRVFVSWDLDKLQASKEQRRALAVVFGRDFIYPRYSTFVRLKSTPSKAAVDCLSIFVALLVRETVTYTGSTPPFLSRCRSYSDEELHPWLHTRTLRKLSALAEIMRKSSIAKLLYRILGIGLNSPILVVQSANSANCRDHVKELNNQRPKQPFFFLKPTSSILPPGAGPVIRPKGVDLHYEIELALIMGKQVKDLEASDEKGALDAIESSLPPLSKQTRRFEYIADYCSKVML